MVVEDEPAYLLWLVLADVGATQHGGFDRGEDLKLSADGGDAFTHLGNKWTVFDGWWMIDFRCIPNTADRMELWGKWMLHKRKLVFVDLAETCRPGNQLVPQSYKE